MEYAGVQSKEYADAMLKAGTPEKIDQEPIGTGPFYLVQYRRTPSSATRRSRSTGAARRRSTTSIFSITPDASVRWAKLQKGECHVMPYPNPADLDAIRKDPNVVRCSSSRASTSATSPTTRPRSRSTTCACARRVNMAINKKAIIDAVYLTHRRGGEESDPADAVVVQRRDQGRSVRSRRREEAAGRRRLSRTASRPTCGRCRCSGRTTPTRKRIAELMQADLAKVGVTAEIKSFEWGEYRKRMQAGEHQMGMLGWTGDNGDPDNFLATLLGCDAAKTNGSNVAKFCYQPYEDLVQKAKTMSGQKAAPAELYEQAQVIFKEQAPWFTIAHAVQLKPVRKEVIDFKLSPFGRHTFYGVDIKEE